MLTVNVPDVICTFDNDADDSDNKDRRLWVFLGFLIKYSGAGQ